MPSTKTEVNSTWVTPHTWVDGSLVSASTMNTRVRNQLSAVAEPGYALAVLDEASNITTTSTSFVDVDGAGTFFTLTVTTNGGPVLVGASGSVGTDTVTTRVFFDIDVDGARIGTDDGLFALRIENAAGIVPFNFVTLLSGLSAASHTFKLQWRVTGGTWTLYAGAGTSNADVHPRLFVIGTA